MLIMPSFKKSLIVEQFQGNYLKSFYLRLDLSLWRSWLQNYPVSVVHTNLPNPSDPKKIHPGEQFQKYAVSVCGFTGFVGTEGRLNLYKKRVRFQKYPDSCGRGLSYLKRKFILKFDLEKFHLSFFFFCKVIIWKVASHFGKLMMDQLREQLNVFYSYSKIFYNKSISLSFAVR